MVHSILVCLAVVSAAVPRIPGATEVARYSFEPAPDRDFLRPDDWTRVIRPGYPFFVEAVLTDEAAATGTRSLVFRLNGGNCAYFSPTSPASRDYNYYLQGQIKTQGLVHDKAFLLLEFLDQRERLVGTQHVSMTVGGTTDWTPVTIGPVAPENSSVRFLRIGCISQHPEEMDLSGSVFFDDLWVGRLPRFEVETSAPYRLFDIDQPKSINVRVSGIENRAVTARFRLSNEKRQLVRESFEELRSISRDVGGATWELPIDVVGYYHVEIALFDGSRQILEQDFPVTVMRADTGRAASEFGLSAPPPAHGLPNYQRLLDYSAAKYLKLPLWGEIQPTDDLYGGGKALARFLEHMSARGQILIGGLQEAPPSVEANLVRPPRGIADIFLLPREKWVPELEGVIARHGLKVTRWQLGGDRDSSFDTLTDFSDIIRIVKTEMDLMARDLHLGATWNWLSPLPQTDALSYLSMTDSPPDSTVVLAGADRTWTPLTGTQLLECLRMARELTPSAAPADPLAPPLLDDQGAPQLWVQLAPLSDVLFARESRLRDFADRILAAKIGGAEGILATALTDPERGLVAPDGSPTELFTLWRTLAEHLGGTQYLGQVYTPGRVQNYAFGSGGGRATIVLQGNEESQSEIVVGPGTRQVDLWGRDKTLTGATSTATLQTEGWPILITNGSEALIRFQLKLRFEKGKLPSEFGRQSDALILENTFPQTLAGRAAPQFPAEWRANPETVDFQIPVGQEFVVPILFDIPQGAAQGDFQIPIDFEIAADRPYRFRVYRPYRLGGDEIQVVTSTRLLPTGQMVVEMQLTNLTNAPLSLQCDLRAYNHNVVSVIVDRLAGGDSTVQQFILQRGRELVDQKMQLQISEIAGRRQFSFLVNESNNDSSAR